MSDILDDILCGGVMADSKCYTPPIKQKPACLTPLSKHLPEPLSKHLPEPLSKPLTVMDYNNTPVIVEDPVRFRKDIQTMVMAQMINGLPDEDGIQEIKDSGTMIEIATVMQLVKAAYGDLDSFKYMMDRVLGKPVSQTNTVSMAISYENMLDKLNPDEVIEPKHVFCEEV